MKEVTTIFTAVLVFVFLFGARPINEEPKVPISSSIRAPIDEDLPEIKNQIEDEFEEYPVEDYFDGTYVETECQDCLESATSDGCLEVHSDCLEQPDCIDWLSCVGWCEAYEGDDDCYDQCNNAFVDNDKVENKLRSCACEMCSINCRVLCGVKEGY